MTSTLPFAFGNAAGPMVKTLEEVERISKEPSVTRIVVGSITLKHREGNQPVPPGGVYYYDPATGDSANALGLPNPGSEYYKQHLPRMVAIAHAAGKELWVSIAGFSPAEFVELTRMCIDAGVDGVELNFGCPNVHGPEGRKPIFSYDVALTTQVLSEVREEVGIGASTMISVKISPVGDELIPPLAQAIFHSGIVSEVVAVNTLPDQQLTRPDGTPGLAFIPPGGTEVKHMGGGAGAMLRAHRERVVRGMRHHLPRSVKIIAAGDIMSGADVLQAQKDGADGVQIGTAVIQEGFGIFDRIAYEYQTLTSSSVAAQ